MTTTEEITMTEPDAMPFSVWLTEQRGGRTHRELSDALAELTDAVLATGKKGSLTLQVTLAPASDANSEALVATDKVQLKPPEPKRDGSIFFVDHAGHLTRRDPNQLTFDELDHEPDNEETNHDH